MTREEFERRYKHKTKWGWDSYGNAINRNPFTIFIRFFESKIRKGDTVEYTDVEYNPKTRKKEKKYLQGTWDGKKVQFEHQQTIVRTTHWLRLVSREYKIGKFIIKRIF